MPSTAGRRRCRLAGPYGDPTQIRRTTNGSDHRPHEPARADRARCAGARRGGLRRLHGRRRRCPRVVPVAVGEGPRGPAQVLQLGAVRQPGEHEGLHRHDGRQVRGVELHVERAAPDQASDDQGPEDLRHHRPRCGPRPDREGPRPPDEARPQPDPEPQEPCTALDTGRLRPGQRLLGRQGHGDHLLHASHRHREGRAAHVEGLLRLPPAFGRRDGQLHREPVRGDRRRAEQPRLLDEHRRRGPAEPGARPPAQASSRTSAR